MDTLCKLLTVLVITFIIYPESGNTFCEKVLKRENETVQVCQEQSLTSDRIYIDSDGAPDVRGITCVCTMERSQNLTINVNISSRVISNGDVIHFQIPIAGYENTYDAKQDRNTRTLNLQDSINITFSKTSARTTSAICLSLEAGGSSDNFTVKCHQHELVAADTTEREAEPSSTITILPTTGSFPTTGSSRPLPLDQGNTNTNSLQTVLIPVIAASAAAVLLTTIFATVIICRKCRRKNNQTSETMKMETTNDRTHVRKNLGYDYAEECPFNNIRRTAKQQRTLQTIAPEDHATDTYVELDELGQQSSCAEPRNDTYSTSSPSKGAKRRETETVYNTVGVVDNADVATENVYSTAGVCAEGVYNTLNETLKAKIANENVYGASAGPVF